MLGDLGLAKVTELVGRLDSIRGRSSSKKVKGQKSKTGGGGDPLFCPI